MVWSLRVGDAGRLLGQIESETAHTCITSPPYFGLRDYGVEGQIGLEPTPWEYVSHLVTVFEQVRHVLRDDGTLWIVIGDSYASSPGRNNANLAAWCAENAAGGGTRAGGEDTPRRGVPQGLKAKDLIGIPWMLAFALRDAGWYLRQEIIWAKGISGPVYRGGSCMPESVKDRCTRSFETVFLLSKSPRYYFDHEAIKEPVSQYSRDAMRLAGNTAGGQRPEGDNFNKQRRYDEGSSTPKTRAHGAALLNADGKRNRRAVWHVNPRPFKGAHFATFPPNLIEPMVLAGTSGRGVCPECGAQWTRAVRRPERPSVRGKAAVDERSGGAQAEQGLEGTGLTHREYDAWLKANPPVTVGWAPGCDCGKDPIPAMVLDPFAGAGTTGVVAIEHGRSFLGIELNPEYAEEIARPRLIEAWRGQIERAR